MSNDGNPLSSNSSDVVRLLLQKFLPQSEYFSDRPNDWSYTETVKHPMADLQKKLEEFGFKINRGGELSPEDKRLGVIEFIIDADHIRLLAKEVYVDGKFFLPEDVLLFQSDENYDYDYDYTAMGVKKTPAVFTIRVTRTPHPIP